MRELKIVARETGLLLLGLVLAGVLGIALAVGVSAFIEHSARHDAPVDVDGGVCEGHLVVWLSCSRDGVEWVRVAPTCSPQEFHERARRDPRCAVLREELDK